MRPDLRPLTDTEIDTLEQALGTRNVEQLGKSLSAEVDGRELLADRVSRIIRDIVYLAIQPRPPDIRDKLRRIARQGRLWLRDIAEDSVEPLVHAHTNFEQLRADVTGFCDQIDVVRQQYGSPRAGAPRRQLLLQVFLGELIGIAKLAGVRPSTPGRAIRPRKPPPPFYKFVNAVLVIGKDVVLSSSLTDPQRQAAQAVFTGHGDEALVKQIELVRGRIGDYIPSRSGHGLVERPKS